MEISPNCKEYIKLYKELLKLKEQNIPNYPDDPIIIEKSAELDDIWYKLSKFNKNGY